MVTKERHLIFTDNGSNNLHRDLPALLHPTHTTNSHLTHFPDTNLRWKIEACRWWKHGAAATELPPRLTLAAAAAAANYESGFDGRTPSTLLPLQTLCAARAVGHHCCCLFKPENTLRPQMAKNLLDAKVIRTMFELCAFTGCCIMSLVNWTWATHCITLLPRTFLRKLQWCGDVRACAAT